MAVYFTVIRIIIIFQVILPWCAGQMISMLLFIGVESPFGPDLGAGNFLGAFTHAITTLSQPVTYVMLACVARLNGDVTVRFS